MAKKKSATKVKSVSKKSDSTKAKSAVKAAPTKTVVKKASKKVASTKVSVTASAPAKAPSRISVDEHCPIAKRAQVVDTWDAMLNQTNIGANNNKFYVIQLLQDGAKYFTWTRWGRVGEVGQSAMLGNGSRDDAEKQFCKKFRDKTSNAWEDRDKFSAKKGKYALIEIDRSASASKKADELEQKLKAIDSEAAKLQKKATYAKSKLHPSIADFMTLIFDHKMFQGAMASFDIDVKKMPLGQITKSQVQKGYDVLESLAKAIDSRSSRKIEDLSSQFYTVIPHAFGRRVPPPISTADLLNKKIDMLNVLNDIEIALGLESGAEKASKEKVLPHPTDSHYKKIKADLEYVDTKSEEYRMVEQYMNATAASYYKLKLVDLFRVNRHGEADRFKSHHSIKERKLLWHGTNVAVVAAILANGLRIMPHSGGRVGKGIYLASENGKSVFYCGWAGTTGVMFLTEAALGREHTITKDNSSLRAAPSGYDSVVARGRTEPDPTKDMTWKFDGCEVTVPQGKPISQSQYKNSNFSQSEYLLYRESQVRIRYVLRVRH